MISPWSVTFLCNPPALRSTRPIQRINYAKSKSYAISRREDPNFVPPTAAHARPEAAQIGKITVSSADKRQRDDDTTDDHPNAKREKSQEDGSDEEEMEIDEDEENIQHVKPLGMQVRQEVDHNSPFLFRSNHACAYTTAVRTSAMHEFTAGSNRRRPFCSLSTVCNFLSICSPLLDDISQISRLLVNACSAVANVKRCRCKGQNGTSILRIRRAGVDGERSLGQLHSQKGLENECCVLLTGLLQCILLYAILTSSEAPASGSGFRFFELA